VSGSKPQRRPLFLTVMLVLLCLGALKAVFTLLFQREQFRVVFSGSTPTLELVAGLLTLCLLVGVVSLWAWWRWAFLFLMAQGLATLVLDLLIRAPWAHTITGAIALVLLCAAVWPVRGHFMPWGAGVKAA
jgi:hypothetical protein